MTTAKRTGPPDVMGKRMGPPDPVGMNRREALGLLGVVGAGITLGSACGGTAVSSGKDAGVTTSDGGPPGCTVTPQETEGPFFVDEKLNRADLVAGETDSGITTGYPLTLVLALTGVTGQSCQPLSGAVVDVWQANVNGVYSDEASSIIQSVVTTGQKFLRGYQVTPSSGLVTFKTIYPGWYDSRTIHIHVKVRLYSAAGDTTLEANFQVYFTDAMNDAVITSPAYAGRGPRSIPKNTNDQVYNGTGPGSAIDTVGLPPGQIPPGSTSVAATTPYDAATGSMASLSVGVQLS